MFSVPCNYTCSSPHLPKLYTYAGTNKFIFPFRFKITKKPRCLPPTKNSSNSTSQPNNAQENLRTLFPGGFKRPEIKIPNVVLKVNAEQVLRNAECVEELVSGAVSKGAGIVVLESSEGDDSGGRLYDAACVLKSLVGDRAYLLIRDRVDIASAVGASGVLLSDQGLPPIVARNMMMISKKDTVYLPLVARTVQTINSAVNASIAEGADFLVMSDTRENCVNVLENSIKQHVKVPIFFNILDSIGGDLPINLMSKLLELGAPGIVLSLENLKLLGDEALKKIFSMERDGDTSSRNSEIEFVRDMLIEKNGIAGFVKLDEREINMIESERLLLREAVSVIKEAAPMVILLC